MGKFLVGLIVVFAAFAGVAMYYLQVYAFYEEVAATGTDDVQLVSFVSNEPEPIVYENFQAIDADSSPIRYRACFTTSFSHAMLTETYVGLDDVVPRNAPGWFDCFQAGQIGDDLTSGVAVAFMGIENVQYGIDRVIAVYPDGRAFAWHQINECGEVVFDGNRAPEHCPPAPERLQ